MAKFKCECSDNIVEVNNLKMKIVSGEVVYEGANCPECKNRCLFMKKKLVLLVLVVTQWGGFDECFA